MKKHILIIGGMGPQASIHAHKRLIETFQNKYPNSDNSDYPRITHLSLNVEDFISDETKKEEAKDYILECLEEIDMSSVDVGFIACNTAHILFDDLQEATDDKLISLIELTKKHFNDKRIGIVASPTTIKQHLYGDDILTPDSGSIEIIEGIIRDTIAGVSSDKLVPTLENEIKKLRDRGAEIVVLGCTELSVVGSHLDLDYTLDPIELVVNAIIDEEYRLNQPKEILFKFKI